MLSWRIHKENENENDGVLPASFRSLEEMVSPDPYPPPLLVDSVETEWCTINITRDSFQPPPFVNPSRVVDSHERAVRLGKADDMFDLISGSPDEAKEYVTGLLASSILVAVAFVLWAILLCVFRWHWRHVGFLRGRFIRPKAPTPKYKAVSSSSPRSQLHSNDDQSIIVRDQEGQQEEQQDRATPEAAPEIDPSRREAAESTKSSVAEIISKKEQEEGPNNADMNNNGDSTNAEDLSITEPVMIEEYRQWLRRCQKQDTRVRRTRITVAFFCIATIVACINFCVYGTKYISRSFSTIYDGFEEIQALCTKSITVIDLFVFRQSTFRNETVDSISYLNQMCPFLAAELCESIDPVYNCSFQQVPEIGPQLDAVTNTLFATTEYVLRELDKVRRDVQDISDEIQRILDNQIPIEWAFWVSYAFALLLGLQCLVIMYGVYKAHVGETQGKRFQFYRKHLVFPFFIFCVVISFVFACCFIIASVGAADFCIDSPSPKISSLLSKKRDSLESIVYGLGQYYVSECDPDLQPFYGEKELVVLVGVLRLINEISFFASQTEPQVWDEECGANITLLETWGSIVGQQTCLLGQTLEDINVLFFCRNWEPIYATFMYEATVRSLDCFAEQYVVQTCIV